MVGLLFMLVGLIGLSLAVLAIALKTGSKKVVKNVNSRKDECQKKGECTSTACREMSVHDIEDSNMWRTDNYKNVRKPIQEAQTLPSYIYTSKTWFRQELTSVFSQSWTLVGRTDEVTESGSYMTIDTLWSGSMFVIRGWDGQLRAFANVCRHRGARLLQVMVLDWPVVLGNSGTTKRIGILCPYHSWCYDPTGRLKSAPGMRDLPNFDKNNNNLIPIRMEIFCGFIFLTANPTAPSLFHNLGDLPERLSTWFGDSQGAAHEVICVRRKTYDVACNWKFLVENTCETYHTSTVHKSSLGSMRSWAIGPHVGAWNAVCVPSERSIVPLPTDFTESPPFPEFCRETHFVILFPSLQFNITWDCMWWMQILPKSEKKSFIDMGFCFPRNTVVHENFTRDSEKYFQRWDIAVQEDNGISENQQRGIHSSAHVPGRYNPLEFGVHNFNNWLLDKVLGEEKWDPGQRIPIPVWQNDQKED